GSQVIVYDDPHWLFMGAVGDMLIAQSAEKGMLKYEGGGWEPLWSTANSVFPQNAIATSITGIGKDSLLLTTLKNGVFLLANSGLSKLQSPLLNAIEKKNI